MCAHICPLSLIFKRLCKLLSKIIATLFQESEMINSFILETVLPLRQAKTHA